MYKTSEKLELLKNINKERENNNQTSGTKLQNNTLLLNGTALEKNKLK